MSALTATLDTNVLLYASDETSPVHQSAKDFLRSRAAGTELLYLFWPAVLAYLRIATHPRIFRNPLDPQEARVNIESLISLPHVRTAGELDGFWDVWGDTTAGLTVRGNLVPDAHLVALMRQHGVFVIWTRDRDFRKFEGIRTKDPFV